MARSLKHNLTSNYLDAGRHLSPKQRRRRIVAYVESYDDIAFWRSLLSEFETEDCYFQVMLPSSKSLAKGKKMVLTNLMRADQFGGSMIACVDSDYDFLLQGATQLSKEIIENPFVLQTYTYAIENYQCYAGTLHDVCVQSTLNDKVIVDFESFLRQYSRIVYPLFLWNIWFYRQRDNNTFPMYEFHDCVRLQQDVDVLQPEAILQDVERSVKAKLVRLQKQYGYMAADVEAMGKELENVSLTPDTAYLFMQGHHIMDNVVLKLLMPVCTQLRRERETDIKRLGRGNWKHMQNELACYENSIIPPYVMLRKNDNYKDLFLYDWMRRDVQNILNVIKSEKK